MKPEEVRKVGGGFVAGVILGGITFAALFPSLTLGIQMAIGCIVVFGGGFLGALLTAMFVSSEEA